MNKNQVEEKWDRFAAKVKKHWGELTDDEVRKAEGNKDELIARIQEKYSDSKQSIAQKFNELVEGDDQ